MENIIIGILEAIALIFIGIYIKHNFQSIKNLIRSTEKFISNIELEVIIQVVKTIAVFIVLIIGICLIIWAIISGGWLAIIAILLFFLLLK